ncbi:HAD family hydrolase [Corticimicrobacter populi]|uniref:Haloacid dehalogenase n=1 Tax=Corticimicrobacter populi TaxID=2175229 RepID=A0A2V1JXV8_9BURK|nr:HAD family hydrolase [Corticimicrobacter populi]PWF23310.1 hypothetical protein DD235_10070 [Corticimicrobacter populi]
MSPSFSSCLRVGLIAASLALTGCTLPPTDSPAHHALSTQSATQALPSWQDRAARQEILAFVEHVTTPGHPDYVPPAERLAVFDNDGTLWAEKPHWFSVQFYIDRVRALAPEHPEWMADPLLASVIANDPAHPPKLGGKEVIRLAALAETGLDQESFRTIARDWLATARHPETGMLYRDMVYQPMLELLELLRGHGFRTYISTGGFDEFTRALAPVYGIQPYEVLATRWKMTYQEQDGGSVVMREPTLDFYNYNEDKPVGIEVALGMRPILAAGNSDGDLAMMTYVADRSGPSLVLLVDHDDAQREYDYARGADRSHARAAERDWTRISIRDDWNTVYPHSR